MIVKKIVFICVLIGSIVVNACTCQNCYAYRFGIRPENNYARVSSAKETTERRRCPTCNGTIWDKVYMVYCLYKSEFVVVKKVSGICRKCNRKYR